VSPGNRFVTAATAPATAPRTDVAADEIIDGDFFVAGVLADRRADAREVVLRVVVLRFSGTRFALNRFVAFRRVDLFALVRALVRLADDRFGMMALGGCRLSVPG
jgi:hypothetical protein